MGRSSLIAETVTLYIDICMCNVLGFRVWSHARMLVSPDPSYKNSGSVLRELEQIHANTPINWYCACRYQPVWVEFH